MNVFNNGNTHDSRVNDMFGKLEKYMPVMFALLIAFSPARC